MTTNTYNFGVYGKQLQHFINDIDTSNTIDSKPVYYWVNRSYDQIPSNAGYVAVVNSTNVAVQNLDIANNHQGVLLAYTKNSKVENVTVMNNLFGFWFFESLNNNILRNNIVTNNAYGIWLNASSGNSIYHNNFMNNVRQVYSNLANNWDMWWYLGGNYWSDGVHDDIFTGSDQNLTGSDGIADKPYNITAQNQDKYPLKESWAPHNVAIIQMLFSKTVVGWGRSFNVTVIIMNRGLTEENSDLTIYWNQSNTLVENVAIQLALTRVTVPLNTSDWNYGSYIMRAYIQPVPEETSIADNNFIGNRVNVTIAGDVNFDKTVNVLDLIIVAGALGTRPGDSGWKPNADLKEDKDNVINILDLIVAAGNLGKTWDP
jgi:parallel beta-helix repeat protein